MVPVAAAKYRKASRADTFTESQTGKMPAANDACCGTARRGLMSRIAGLVS
jgi:hypothetical protein